MSSLTNEKDLHFVGEHCGFDMFESPAYRRWHVRPEPYDFTRAPPPEISFPVGRARLFGWPDGNGVTYEHGIRCTDGGNCSVDARPRDWLKLTYHFDQDWLCDIPKVIPAHLDWLESRVVEEETDILNPAYR